MCGTVTKEEQVTARASVMLVGEVHRNSTHSTSLLQVAGGTEQRHSVRQQNHASAGKSALQSTNKNTEFAVNHS